MNFVDFRSQKLSKKSENGIFDFPLKVTKNRLYKQFVCSTSQISFHSIDNLIVHIYKLRETNFQKRAFKNVKNTTSTTRKLVSILNRILFHIMRTDTVKLILGIHNQDNDVPNISDQFRRLDFPFGITITVKS